MRKNAWFGLHLLFTFLTVSPSLVAQSATITWTTEHQTIDGFGGEVWPTVTSGTASQLNLFFSTTSGIGYSIVRLGNQSCGYLDVTGPCAVSTTTVPQYEVIQNAVADGAVVELYLYPPATLKYSENFNSGATGSDGSCVDTSNFVALANYDISWLAWLNNTNGTPVTYFFPFNEPDSPSASHCIWSAAGVDAYIKVLGPALSSAGFGNVKIGIPDVGHWFDDDVVSTCLNDSACAEYVSVIGAHDYGTGSVDGGGTGYCCHTYTSPPSAVVSSGKPVWMDEVNGGFSYNTAASLWNWDASIADGMLWAHNIHDAIVVGGVSVYNYWNIIDCQCGGVSTPLNDGISEADLTTVGKRYYVIGQWSKFVRPGWVRIDTTANPANGIYVTAFKEDSSGNFAIVTVNENSASVNVEFSLTGFPSASSVTPTVTSASASLEDQANVNISNGTFSYTLPGSSVTTFHGTASASASAASKAPASPTNLAATVN